MSPLEAYARSVAREAKPPVPEATIHSLLEPVEAVPSLVALWTHIGGTNPTKGSMALLAPSEALQTTRLMYEHFLTRREDAPFLCVWCDGNDSFVVFVGGSLVGMVAFLDHEETVPVPAYTSVTSFVRCVVDSGDSVDEWRDLPRELPSAHGNADNAKLRDAWLQAFSANNDDRYAGLVACQFLTLEDEPTVLSLLSSTNMFVQERACQLAGLWRLESAVEPLEHVAVHGLQNGRIAAILASVLLAVRRRHNPGPPADRR